jgi:transposase
MATQRLTMKNIREILRQKWALQRSHRDVAASLDVSAGVVGKVALRADALGLDWAAVVALDDDELEVKLYGPRLPSSVTRPPPNPVWIHEERKRAGVTLELLHLEYLEQHPDGYRYSQFCDYYREWVAARRLTMRQEHLAGDKLFTDYSGKKPRIVDPATGEQREVELFVAVLGASNDTFAEATLTQSAPDWIASHCRAFAFLGGVTAAVVPDQLKSGVTVACHYEPGA